MLKNFNPYTVAIILLSSCFTTKTIANTELTSIVKWETTAVKNSHSNLVANSPNKVIKFEFSPYNQNFNTVSVDYNLDVLIPNGVTDTVFKTKVITNTLTKKDDPSALNVGVHLNGKELSKNHELILKNNNDNSQNIFIFNINSANIENKNVDFKDLNNGIWKGDVMLGFTAYWVS